MKINVNGVEIRMEYGHDKNYVSLTDIAKQNSETEPYFLIRNWLRNSSTLIYLNEWETVFNPNFKPDQMSRFRNYSSENKNDVTPAKYIDATNAIGLISKPGRYGGTYAHPDIAVNFCYWLSPAFNVWMVREFQMMKEREFEIQNLKWHIEKITDNLDEARNLLDTIPHQNPKNNRLKK